MHEGHPPALDLDGPHPPICSHGPVGPSPLLAQREKTIDVDVGPGRGLVTVLAGVVLAQEHTVEICIETQMVAILGAETQNTQKDTKRLSKLSPGGS